MTYLSICNLLGSRPSGCGPHWSPNTRHFCGVLVIGIRGFQAPKGASYERTLG
jgi:hypothetical protein